MLVFTMFAIVAAICWGIFGDKYLAQARLYRAKSLVDSCVTIALLSVALFPASTVSYYLDLVGSVIVALYLIWCGIQTIAERIKK